MRVISLSRNGMIATSNRRRCAASWSCPMYPCSRTFGYSAQAFAKCLSTGPMIDTWQSLQPRMMSSTSSASNHFPLVAPMYPIVRGCPFRWNSGSLSTLAMNSCETAFGRKQELEFGNFFLISMCISLALYVIKSAAAPSAVSAFRNLHSVSSSRLWTSSESQMS